MTRFSKGMAVTAIAAAAVVGLGTTEASATPTWTVSGGTSWSATASKPTLKDNNTGATLNCSSATAAGTAKNGTGLAGAGLGSITSAGWTSCTGPLGLSFSVTAQTLPWALNAVSYASGVTTGTITGVSAHISGACSATFTAGSGGLAATYTNSTHTLTVSGNLTVSGAVGCLGVINNGDTGTYSASYVVTPALTITSP